MQILTPGAEEAAYFFAQAIGETRGFVSRIEGQLDGAACYLQVFDGNYQNVGPATGTVPKWSSGALNANTGFAFDFAGGDDIYIGTGLYVALSSTDATYTAVAGGQLASMFVFCTNLAQTPAAFSIAGDLTTNVHSLQAWADAATPQYKIRRIEIKYGNLATTEYPMLFCHNDPAAGAYPIRVLPGLPTGAAGTLVLDEFFDEYLAEQYSPQYPLLGDNLGDSTFHYGLTVAMSSTQTTLTLSALNYQIRVTYKA